MYARVFQSKVGEMQAINYSMLNAYALFNCYVFQYYQSLKISKYFVKILSGKPFRVHFSQISSKNL